MNIWSSFGRLEYYEVRGGSIVMLVSLGNPPIPKDDKQNSSAKQTMVRMPISGLKDFDEGGIEIGDYVELFGNIGGIAKHNTEKNEVNAYPQIILKSVTKAVLMDEHSFSKANMVNSVRLAALVKFISKISDDDATDPRKPLVVYAQISAKKERPKPGEVVLARTTDTIPLPCYNQAKEYFLKNGSDCLNKAFLLSGAVSGRISKIQKKDSDEIREDLNPVISILSATECSFLPERMLNPSVISGIEKKDD